MRRRPYLPSTPSPRPSNTQVRQLGRKTTTPGTKLHDEWHGLAAPGIAKARWKLHDDAKWVDCLQHMLADESHHRDVNHTFATLPEGAPNPASSRNT